VDLHEELHRLIKALDAVEAREQMHTLTDDLDEDQARKALIRLRARRPRDFLERLGFVLF
jgi:hypothetical protein